MLKQLPLRLRSIAYALRGGFLSGRWRSRYATTDAAVSLRLLRLLQDVAGTVGSEAVRRRIVERGRRLVEECRGRLPADNFFRLEQRLAVLEGIGDNAVSAELARRHQAASMEEVQAEVRPP